MLFDFYGNLIYRKMRWQQIKRTWKSESKFLKLVKKTYGVNCILCYGVWNRRSQIKGLIPSPTVGFKEKLRKRFFMVDVPEWNTTKTCFQCSGELKPTNIKTYYKKKGEVKTKECWELRRCSQCKKFINRERNGAFNILQNWIHFEQNGVWDARFLPRQHH